MTIYMNPGDNIREAGAALRSGDSLVFRAGLHYGQLTVPLMRSRSRAKLGAILEGTHADRDDWTLATDSDGITSLAGSGTWRVPQSAAGLAAPGAHQALRSCGSILISSA